jgi:hypothetical protein
MLRANLWNKRVSRVELYQRARDARPPARADRTTAGAACCTDRFLAPARALAF